MVLTTGEDVEALTMAISVIHHFNLNVNGGMGQVGEDCLPPFPSPLLIILSHPVSQILMPEMLISLAPFPSLRSLLLSPLRNPQCPAVS